MKNLRRYLLIAAVMMLPGCVVHTYQPGVVYHSAPVVRHWQPPVVYRPPVWHSPRVYTPDVYRMPPRHYWRSTPRYYRH
jgi:hypothetical protein